MFDNQIKKSQRLLEPTFGFDDPKYLQCIDLINTVACKARSFNDAAIEKTLTDAEKGQKDYPTLVRICALIINAKIKIETVKVLFDQWAADVPFAGILIMQCVFISKTTTKSVLYDFVSEDNDKTKKMEEKRWFKYPFLLSYALLHCWSAEFFTKLVTLTQQLANEKKVDDTFVDSLCISIKKGNKIEYSSLILLLQAFSQNEICKDYLYKIGKEFLSTAGMYQLAEYYNFVEMYVEKEPRLTVLALQFPFTESEVLKIIPHIVCNDEERIIISNLIITRKIDQDSIVGKQKIEGQDYKPGVVEKYLSTVGTDKEKQEILFSFFQDYMSAGMEYTQQQVAEYLKKFGPDYPSLIHTYLDLYPFSDELATKIYASLPIGEQEVKLWGRKIEVN